MEVIKIEVESWIVLLEQNVLFIASWMWDKLKIWVPHRNQMSDLSHTGLIALTTELQKAYGWLGNIPCSYLTCMHYVSC